MLPQATVCRPIDTHANTRVRAKRTISPMPAAPSPWPYPRWIAHRGAGTLAPENTLAAFRCGWQHGWRMFECDVRLSADGVPFLLHDDRLERTSSGQGAAADHHWSELAQLDAGSWHSPDFQSEHLLTLETLARWILPLGGHLNLEIKPHPGSAWATGQTVARMVQDLWHAHAAGQPGSPTWPLLTSFQPEALAAAQAVAPALPRGLLVKDWSAAVWDQARVLGCVAMVLHHPLWTGERVAQAHHRGLRALSYTVNRADDAQRLLDWGLDGLISDAVDRLGPGATQAAPG